MSHEKTTGFPVVRWQAGEFVKTTDWLAEEVPATLEYNGFSHAVMLVTPGDLEDFALGFSLTEGIVTDLSEVRGCEVCLKEDGIRIVMEIDSERFRRLKAKSRICPAMLSEHVLRESLAAKSAVSTLVTRLQGGFAQMEARQALRMQTGATHAAAWMDDAGQVTLLREDVGRHNALDKLIGALARQGTLLSCGSALVTSRASCEMVKKCLSVGITVLAAVSAPTARAVRMAEKGHLALIGFARQGGHTLYTSPEKWR